MKDRTIIRFFVLGTSNENQAKYLAHVIRTQEGITSSNYSSGSHLLSITYEPEIITFEDIKALASSIDCKLVFDEKTIEEYSKAWRQWRYLGKVLLGVGLALFLCLFFLVLGIFPDFKENAVWEYIVAVIVLAGFIGSWVWRRILKDKIDGTDRNS